MKQERRVKLKRNHNQKLGSRPRDKLCSISGQMERSREEKSECLCPSASWNRSPRPSLCRFAANPQANSEGQQQQVTFKKLTLQTRLAVCVSLHSCSLRVPIQPPSGRRLLQVSASCSLSQTPTPTSSTPTPIPTSSPTSSTLCWAPNSAPDRRDNLPLNIVLRARNRLFWPIQISSQVQTKWSQPASTNRYGQFDQSCGQTIKGAQ